MEIDETLERYEVRIQDQMSWSSRTYWSLNEAVDAYNEEKAKYHRSVELAKIIAWDIKEG